MKGTHRIDDNVLSKVYPSFVCEHWAAVPLVEKPTTLVQEAGSHGEDKFRGDKAIEKGNVRHVDSRDAVPPQAEMDVGVDSRVEQTA